MINVKYEQTATGIIIALRSATEWGDLNFMIGITGNKNIQIIEAYLLPTKITFVNIFTDYLSERLFCLHRTSFSTSV